MVSAEAGFRPSVLGTYVRMATYSAADFSAAKQMLAAGMSAGAAARELGIPRGTIQRWRHRSQPPVSAIVASRAQAWSISDPDAYCYLFGAYLGDGTISQLSAQSWALRIVNDRRYQSVSAEILVAMRTIFPGANARMWPSYREKSDTLEVIHPAIARAFPQHGPGRKHTRPIVLADWQRALTHAHPAALIRG